MNNSNYVLIGSSSALSKGFVNLSLEESIYTVSTKDFSSNSHLQVSDYINDIDLIASFISKIKENRP